jgi:hypothetical protein
MMVEESLMVKESLKVKAQDLEDQLSASEIRDGFPLNIFKMPMT